MNTNNPQDNQDPNVGSPYYGRGDAQPNLDAGAPNLRSEENQRLDRRAMVFLAGTAVLLLLLGFWAVSSFSSRNQPEPEPEPVAEQNAITVPNAPAPNLPTPNIAEAEPETEAIALEDDEDVPVPQFAQAPVNTQPAETPAQRRRRELLESRIASATADVPSEPEAAASADAREASKATASVRRLEDPDTLMIRGTYIRCVLETRIITDVSGFTSCLVTEPVYSINGRRLLLAKGSKISGQYASGAITGERVAILWDRITTPNGLDIDVSSPGVDNLGGAGHPGNYNAHWGKRITAALMISLLSDAFKYAGEKYGPRRQTFDLGGGIGGGFVVDEPFESNTAEAMQELATRAIEENTNQPPTVTINQGSLLNIYVAKDINFSEVL